MTAVRQSCQISDLLSRSDGETSLGEVNVAHSMSFEIRKAYEREYRTEALCICTLCQLVVLAAHIIRIFYHRSTSFSRLLFSLQWK